MPGTLHETGGADTAHHNVYPVLLHHYAPSFTGMATGSTPGSASSGSLHREIALNARFRIQQDQLCLILTYDPSKQATASAAAAPAATPKGTPTTRKQSLLFAKGSPKRKGSKLSWSGAESGSASGKSKESSPTYRKGGGAKATPNTPLSPVDPHRHPKQYYVIALKDISPLAAQLPLSAELRAHLRLNLVDGDAVTYSSHSTPRATALSYGGGGGGGAANSAGSNSHYGGFLGVNNYHSNNAAAAAALTSNFYFPPSRGPVVMSQRTRHDSPSSGFAAMTAPATYGQYLSAEEPYKVHTRSLQSPRSHGVALGSRQHTASPLGEGDFTMIHESHPSSRQASKSNSPLLMPQRDAALGDPVPLSAQNSAFDDSSTPQTLVSPTVKFDALTDYAELLLVAFFGVVTAAGVPNMSFSTDPQGEVMVEKKKKKLSSRPWHKSLFKWFVPSKSTNTLPKRSVSTLSNISAAISNSTGSPQVSPAQPNPPSGLPAKTAKAGKLSAPSSTTKRVSSPVSAAAAHVDPQKVLELPFALNQHETFHLRFLCEDDLHKFLSRYVELQTRLREAARAKDADASSPLWHPRARKPTVGANRFGDEDEDDQDSSDGSSSSSDGEEGEGGDTGSTASYNDYPRNSDALGGDGERGDDGGYDDGGGDGGGRQACDDPLSAEPGRRTNSAAGSHKKKSSSSGGAAPASSAAPPTVFFRSRGWEEYLRYTLDPRFGVPFATIPLYLWHSFLPMAQLVLYTCHRGFLIVERVPPEATLSDEDSSSNAASLTDPERAVEVGKQRLNALVNRLLTPIRTAQSPPRHPPSAAASSQHHPQQQQQQGMNRHGVVEVLPLAPLPLADDNADSFNSSGTSSWESVKLVLPSTDAAVGQRHCDHFTTVKDVFLCLSESHLLFMNSFGHLRFQCSLDEIALITHSAATADFPTYPFFRFRLKSSDYFGAPTFVLTFTLLPEVPHEIRAASLARVQAAHQSQHPQHPQQQPQKQSPLKQQQQQQPSKQQSKSSTHARTPSVASSATSTASDRFRSANDSVALLTDDEKERLLQRHEDFLRIFAAVCPRPLECRTFGEMIAGELGRSSRIRFSHLTSRPQTKVSGSPIVHFGPGHVPERGLSWMAQNFNANPILCVKVEADDINLCDAEVGGNGEGKSRGTTTTTTVSGLNLGGNSTPPAVGGGGGASTFSPSAGTSSRPQDVSMRRRSRVSVSPELRRRPSAQGAAVTPRWGYDDPGLVLEDAGRDMDFSLEVATRTMPLLASKEEVHAGYGSNLASTQQSFHQDEISRGGETSGAVAHTVSDSNGGNYGGEEFFVPMAPKKKKSIILHRTAMDGA